ncbi:hypothetical protein C8R46DRAFT_1307883, partial [Mycena filopes]
LSSLASGVEDVSSSGPSTSSNGRRQSHYWIVVSKIGGQVLGWPIRSLGHEVGHRIRQLENLSPLQRLQTFPLDSISDTAMKSFENLTMPITAPMVVVRDWSDLQKEPLTGFLFAGMLGTFSAPELVYTPAKSFPLSPSQVHLVEAWLEFTALATPEALGLVGDSGGVGPGGNDGGGGAGGKGGGSGRGNDGGNGGGSGRGDGGGGAGGTGSGDEDEDEEQDSEEELLHIAQHVEPLAAADLHRIVAGIRQEKAEQLVQQQAEADNRVQAFVDAQADTIYEDDSDDEELATPANSPPQDCPPKFEGILHEEVVESLWGGDDECKEYARMLREAEREKAAKGRRQKQRNGGGRRNDNNKGGWKKKGANPWDDDSGSATGSEERGQGRAAPPNKAANEGWSTVRGR